MGFQFKTPHRAEAESLSLLFLFHKRHHRALIPIQWSWIQVSQKKSLLGLRQGRSNCMYTIGDLHRVNQKGCP